MIDPLNERAHANFQTSQRWLLGFVIAVVTIFQPTYSAQNAYLVQDFYQGEPRVPEDNPGTPVGVFRPPHYFAELETFALFDAENASNGWELWRTDGTANGTHLVKDILPGHESSFPGPMAVKGGVAFLMATSLDGYELWRSDGTPKGTQSLGGGPELIGSYDPGFVQLIEFDNGVIFRGNEKTSEIWSYVEGAGFRPLLSERLEIDPRQRFNCSLGAEVVMDQGNSFAAELWRTDGTPTGTRALELSGLRLSGRNLSQPYCSSTGYLYFLAFTDEYNFSDVILARIKELDREAEILIDSGTDLAFQDLAYLELVSEVREAPLLFLRSGSGQNTRTELVILAESETTTVDLEVRTISYPPEVLRMSDSTLIRTRTPSQDVVRIASDGTAEIVLANARPTAYGALLEGSGFFTSANDSWPSGTLWRVGPGSELSALASGFRYGYTDTRFFIPFPGSLFRAGERVVFRDSNLPRYFSNLRSADETDQSAEVFLSTYEPTTGSSPIPLAGGPTISISSAVLADDERHVRVAVRGANRPPITIDAGRPEPLRPRRHVVQTGQRQWLVLLEGSAHVTNGWPAGTRELWRSRLENNSEFSTVSIEKGELLFFFGRAFGAIELLIFDSERESIEQFASLQAGPASSIDFSPFSINERVLFASWLEETGVEPWVTDGTAEGTQLLIDVNPGEASSFPSSFFQFEGKACFFSELESAQAVWCSDGTPDGTAQLGLIPTEQRGRLEAVVQDGRLWVGQLEGPSARSWFVYSAAGKFEEADFFEGPEEACLGEHTDPTSVFVAARVEERFGKELVQTNCLSGQVRVVADIEPGPNSSSPEYLVRHGDIVLFSAFRSDVGRELFYFDTATGRSGIASDLKAGPQSASPSHLIQVDSEVFFAADAEGSNRELWGIASAGVRVSRRLRRSPTEAWVLDLGLTGKPSRVVTVEYNVVDEERGSVRQGEVSLSAQRMSATIPLGGLQQGRAEIAASREAFVLTPTVTLDLRNVMFKSSFEPPL